MKKLIREFPSCCDGCWENGIQQGHFACSDIAYVAVKSGFWVDSKDCSYGLRGDWYEELEATPPFILLPLVRIIAVMLH